LQRIACLDGLRGLAALWVLVGHCMLLTGFYLPVMGQPDFGVDLFILLSGFLMVFQYQLRQNFEDWGRPGTWASFWTRRFFRIAPLFYLMLAAALLAGPGIYEDRVVIDAFLDREPQAPARYLDSGATNIALHVTFLFGLLPSYAFRTPLPDWSLGLEMQFYAVFPFLILLMRKLSWPVTALLVSSAAAAVVWAMSMAGISFPMPAFLPLKMHLFLCGMLTAGALGGGRRRLALHLGLVIMLAAIPIGGTQDLQHVVVRALIVLVFFALVHARAAGVISALLGSRPLYWLGELSYGVYLVHLLIMQPVAAWAITNWGDGMGAAERCLLVLGIVAPLAYAIAFVTYTIVEVPAQKMGKSLLRAFTANRRNASQTPAEEITVP
jgi:peptidoglycan/LPS O-acetylase OafA/YrhL